MVGHHDVNPAAGKRHHLITCGDSIVHRDDEGGLTRLDHAVERLGREAVPFLEAVGNEGVHTCAELAQGLGQQASRGDAVHVEIAEHRRPRRRATARSTRAATSAIPGIMSGSAQSRSREGVRKSLPLLDAADPMRDHDARDQRRDAESGGEPLSSSGLLGAMHQRCVVESEAMRSNPLSPATAGMHVERSKYTRAFRQESHPLGERAAAARRGTRNETAMRAGYAGCPKTK